MKQGNERGRRILLAFALLLFCLSGCGNAEKKEADSTVTEGKASSSLTEDMWLGLTVEARVENVYASEYRIDRLSGGFSRITIREQEYLIVPPGAEIPEGIPKEVTVIRRPKEKIYVASSSAMSFFQALGILDKVGYTSTRAADWAEEEIRNAVDQDRITYVGKYNAPDYEWLMQEGASIAVENTMLLHSPKTKEQLEQLGIPVLIEYSSYEKHPMGRLEWVRVYGCILGMEEEADRYFAAEDARFRKITAEAEKNNEDNSAVGPAVIAYFYMNPNGYVSIQRPGSYVAEMIRLAGGTYFYSSDTEEDTAGGNMNLQTDRFYEAAKDADVLIYNGAIYGPPEGLMQLTEDYPLLKDFKAVQSGRVYVTGDNLFQGVTHMNDVLEELTAIRKEQEGDGRFFRKLQ